jgi:aminoglycoside 6'-N-acetyltransferase
MVVELRPMNAGDVGLLVRWDDDADVAAALGGPGAEWYDWPTELARDVTWRECLIAEEDGRPIGFLQLTDAAEEESHYWGDIEAGTWAVDIWIGSPSDRGRGVGTEAMQIALRRLFDDHGADVVVIDPLVTNRRAIEFYRRLGFEAVEERELHGDRCLVMRRTRLHA